MVNATSIVKIQDIYLDLNNPRYTQQQSESEAIEYLIANEDVKVLAKHIAEIGSTSPLELMALVPHSKIKNAYFTAEGNRRLCALKLLVDPDKAKYEKDKAYFKKLKDGMKLKITTVSGVIFKSFELARPWVELRHDPQTGVGTKRWDASQKGRFNKLGRADTPNARALDLMDYARAEGLLSEALLQNIPITTLTRFLSTPDVRSAIGLASTSGIEINVQDSDFNKALKKFLEDASNPDGAINSRANAEDRKLYAENFRVRGFSPKNRGVAIHSPGIRMSSQASNGLTPVTQKRVSAGKSAKSRDKDKKIIPSGFVSKVKDPVFSRLFRELKELDAETFSFAGVYLMRALIEQASVLYLKKMKVPNLPDKLHLKLGAVSKELQASGYSGRGLKALNKMASDVNSTYSPDTIGNFVHGGAIPNRVYIIKLWDTFQPTLEEILKEIVVNK
ncbi:hypothetical protein [Polynucleobacter sp. AM-25C3]|uniref:hypothetical protein n=1 Tax=Polynucleobacter sp. AM-25C3 TaxID=1855569 RepID=UPI001C0DEBC1|nr:hypothetical protein [Polynucleobacter sp. AM-25C3]MBU3600757.1 hypothetical protein [Polynucleobacter sp. AM-25C3]